MRDYDDMIARMVERDGVRMASGHHIDSPIPRHNAVPSGWESCDACGAAWDPCVKGHHCRGRNGRWVNHAALRQRNDPDVLADPWIDRRDNDR